MLKVTGIGNLGADDAELKQSDSGYEYVKFSVALKDHKNDPTVWFNASWFGKQAKACLPRLTSGTQIFVVGKYKVRTFQTHAGEDRISHDLNVQDLVVLTGSAPTESSEDVPF